MQISSLRKNIVAVPGVRVIEFVSIVVKKSSLNSFFILIILGLSVFFFSKIIFLLTSIEEFITCQTSQGTYFIVLNGNINIVKGIFSVFLITNAIESVLKSPNDKNRGVNLPENKIQKTNKNIINTDVEKKSDLRLLNCDFIFF